METNTNKGLDLEDLANEVKSIGYILNLISLDNGISKSGVMESSALSFLGELLVERSSHLIDLELTTKTASRGD